MWAVEHGLGQGLGWGVNQGLGGHRVSLGSHYQPQSTSTKSKQCGKCGKTPKHSWTECPAKDVEYRKCQKKGHFAAVCRTVQKLDSIEEDMAAYLGAVDYPQSSTWTEILTINGSPLHFKLNMGASVTAIPESEFTLDRYGRHSAPRRPLLGPADQPLDVKGQVHAVIQIGDKKIKEVFIVKDLTTLLLGLPAIRRLQMIFSSIALTMQTLTFAQLTQMYIKGWVTLRVEYKIKLRYNATPYALSAPQPADIPLRAKVKEELDRMEKMGVIACVEEPTE
ncbi:uncharacterized protein K02A2.6-like [Tachysurus ichikawai]